MTEGPPAGPRVVLGRETSPTPSREVRAVIVLLILTVSCLSHIFAHCHILYLMSTYFLLITTSIPSHIRCHVSTEHIPAVAGA